MSTRANLQHINVNVDNMAEAVAFYHGVIGLELDPTPDQGFESQFFRINDTQQIHMNVIADEHPFRGHFCLDVDDFMGVFARAKAAGVIDTAPWGRVRQLPTGKMQMFLRDPHGNLVEIGSLPEAVIDPELFEDPLVEPERGVYRMEPGATVGGHETNP
jgi:lactoylglutathione lyase